MQPKILYRPMAKRAARATGHAKMLVKMFHEKRSPFAIAQQVIAVSNAYRNIFSTVLHQEMRQELNDRICTLLQHPSLSPKHRQDLASQLKEIRKTELKMLFKIEYQVRLLERQYSK